MTTETKATPRSAKRLALVSLTVLITGLHLPTRAEQCPPAGARFERNNAGTVGVLSSLGGTTDSWRWCQFNYEGKTFRSQLKYGDRPLDPVPRNKGGTCPAGQIGAYKWVVSETRATIGSGPDAAGRCEMKHEDGRVTWMYPDEFKLVGSAPQAANLSAPKPGSAFDCTLPGIGMFTGANFGIIDGSTYRNQDGKRGSYTFDAATRVLRLTSGPSKGMAYLQESERNFRVLDDKGKRTGGNCALSGKSIDGRW